MKKIYSSHQTDTEEFTTVALIPRYRVLLHNDAVNTMDFVTDCLVQVFSFTWEQAWAVMFEAHTNGLALCATEPLETAEFHRDKLVSFGLLSTIEEEVE